MEVIPDSLWERDRIRLLVDGEEIAETKANGPKTVLAGDGFEIRAVMPFWGGSVKRAELVPADGGAPVLLEPEPGTRAARRAKFEREHPHLYASRHVVKGAAQVALAIIGLTFLLRFLPAIPWPDIDLPSIPLPHIDLPDIPWPSIDLPDIAGPGLDQGDRRRASSTGCRSWSGSSSPTGELQRRKRRNVERDDRAGDPARPRTGAPE